MKVLSDSRFLGFILALILMIEVVIAFFLFVWSAPRLAEAAPPPSYYTGGSTDFERAVARQLDELNRQLARIADDKELERTISQELDETNRRLSKMADDKGLEQTISRKFDETNRQLSRIVDALSRIERN